MAGARRLPSSDATAFRRGIRLLIVHRLDVRRGEQGVIRHASLCADSPGLLFLVGAGGAGKSTLLAALSPARAQHGLRVRGMCELDGRDLLREPTATVHLPQHACLRGSGSVGEALQAEHGLARDAAARCLQRADFAPAVLDLPVESLGASARRLLARLATLEAAADAYLLDEPGADLDDAHLRCVRRRIAELAGCALVLVATHNRQDCLELGGRTALLAGGTIRECADSARFFVAPETHAGRTYVDTGNCNLAASRSGAAAGDGIWWVVPGLLCGMSRPGLVREAPAQYQRLADSGVRSLICMEERRDYPIEAVREHGLEFHHFPVPDMAPPNFLQAVDLCRTAEPRIGGNQGVAVHCRGGLGRTGTALAAVLVWFGDPPDQAIARVRASQPLAIQNHAQTRFLHDFADRIRGWH